MLVSRKYDFKQHDLLTVQMLESLRDGALDAAIAPYVTYADGIVSGLDVSMQQQDIIHIAPGAVKWQSRLYVMTSEVTLHLPSQWNEGYVVLQAERDHFAIVLEQERLEGAIVVAAFTNRDAGSMIKQPTQLKRMRFANYFDASVVRISGSDGLLTYNGIVANCFAQELLAKAGVTPSDVAFAWQALQAPPTKTMWQLYFAQNGKEWRDDGFIDILQAILNEKNEPLLQYVQAIKPANDGSKKQPIFGLTID